MSRIITAGSSAVHASTVRHYYHRPQPPSRPVGQNLILVPAGPAFALLIPPTYRVETQPPANATAELPIDPSDPISYLGDVFVVVLVVLIAGQIIVRTFLRRLPDE